MKSRYVSEQLTVESGLFKHLGFNSASFDQFKVYDPKYCYYEIYPIGILFQYLLVLIAKNGLVG